MEIRWLKDFETLAALKNFSRAAEECNVSQPAFSRRIRMLESEVEVELINRQTLPLSLTPAGEVFLVQAGKILRTFAETIERCQIVDAASADVIRFATTQSLYLTHYEAHIKGLVDKGGLDIDLNSTTWSADQFVSALQQRYCDVILTYWHPSMEFLAPLEVAKCDYITLAHDRLVPVVKHGPNAGRLPGVKGKPISVLGYGAISTLGVVVDDIMSKQLNPPSVLVVSRNGQALGVKAMIQQDFGMGWLPLELCKDELKAGTLQLAGGPEFEANLEIRLYKDSENTNIHLRKLWARIEKAMQPARNVVTIGKKKPARRA
ncbi:MAG: LysR family transcriptional regulator [Rhodobacteraceae bacterium]|nr:LysR family transcriptional regulator [Paracoccaceae bacterium]